MAAASELNDGLGRRCEALLFAVESSPRAPGKEGRKDDISCNHKGEANPNWNDAKIW